MAQKKAQFKVQQLKNWANQELKRTDEKATDAYKQGLCTTLEMVLNACGWDISYTYNYWDEKGYIQWQRAGSPSADVEDKNKYLLGPTGQEYNRNYH